MSALSSAELVAALSYRASSAEQFKDFPGSLSLLKTIDSTLDAIREEQRFVDHYADILMDKGDKLMANLGSEILDKDGSFFDVLLKAQKAIQNTHRGIKNWRSEANERNLGGYGQEIMEEVNRFTDSLSSIHNYLNTLRVAVATHDAKRSRIVATFQSSEELIASLK